jgi:hypothetical protein
MQDSSNAVQNPFDERIESPLNALVSSYNLTPGPWKVRAGTFCEDGIPSYEVVMPGEPRVSACDARAIGAVPELLKLIDVALGHLEERDVHIGADAAEDWATERAMTAHYIREEVDRLLAYHPEAA